MKDFFSVDQLHERAELGDLNLRQNELYNLNIL